MLLVSYRSFLMGVRSYGLRGGHLYLWSIPLLAPVSTVGKPRLVVVAVQGAPLFSPFIDYLCRFPRVATLM